MQGITPAQATDPAAILGAAISLKAACESEARERYLNLSVCYNGGDEFMRQVMRVATLFEQWCCEHVDFDQCSEVWPYLLEDKFGDSMLVVCGTEGLASFDEAACLRVAIEMRLPVKVLSCLHVPVNLTASNPQTGSPFQCYQIRSVRLHHEDGSVEQYTRGDDPEDENFGEVFFGLYGLEEDGVAEHIADRGSYAALLMLARKLAPGILFPEAPTLLDSLR